LAAGYIVDDDMNDISTAPTSTATTRNTEPEIVAGISSAEGQPALYEFKNVPAINLTPRLAMIGAAAVFGMLLATAWVAGWRQS